MAEVQEKETVVKEPKEEGECERSVAESFQAPIGILFSRSEILWDGLIWLLAEEAADTTPYARWMSKTAYGEDWDIQLCVSPIRVAEQLRKNLWWRCYGAVVTSATLTALKFIDFLRFKLPSFTSSGSAPQKPAFFIVDFILDPIYKKLLS
mgnify:CR=1 FL=1